MRYGDTADIGGLPERFEPGAFGDVGAADVLLNRQHDRTEPLARTGGAGLVLMDTADSLTMRADLPDTATARDTVALVRSGVLRGLSVEFVVRRERDEGGVRVIEQADLMAIGLVDTPAYPASDVAARHKQPATRRRSVWL